MRDFTGGGDAPFRDRALGDPSARIVVDVAVGEREVVVEVIVDTGGTWVVLEPEVARRAGVCASPADPRLNLLIRGESWPGRLVRSRLVLLAEHGEDLVLEGTFFVPETEPGDVWTYPSFLGWSGGLERVRFGVDPVGRRFWFAAA